MKVFKFGGGILHSAEEIRRMPAIIKMFPGEQLVIVVSAFGKTTNALEKLIESAFDHKPGTEEQLQEILDYHQAIIHQLFNADGHEVRERLSGLTEQLTTDLATANGTGFSAFYDRIICYGELFSSVIVHFFLQHSGIQNHWFDVRQVLITDSSFRDAAVDWAASRDNAEKHLRPVLRENHQSSKILITQGFIGSDPEGRSTSLGREGSDYTASIFANLLDASEVIIWKDVPGILNADPKHFRQTIKLDEISYAEATELAYYGAKVIHPKTVKPLQNKQIPLQVRSFLNPREPGTLIHANAVSDHFIPTFIFKFDQVLISVSRKDLSFVDEQLFSDVFALLSRHAMHMNIIQNSALTLTFCIDNSPRLGSLVRELQEGYNVKYNEGLELITVRHYNEHTAGHVLQGKEVLLEQQNRTVVQYVVR